MISELGKVNWSVPATWDVAENKVIVSVSDDSGQSTFHTSTVYVPEAPEQRRLKLAKAEQQRRLAAGEARREAMQERLLEIEREKGRCSPL